MRSSRLMSMLLLLQVHERMTSGELARRLEVSQRTILRDVEALSAAGVPVHTERGRAGAIVLDRRARLDPARLEPAEIQLLSVASLEARQLRHVGLQQLGSRAQEKLATAAARRPETSPERLAEILLIDASGWYASGQEVDLTMLLNAARDRRRVRLRYRHSGDSDSAWLVADPYGLVSKAASWYLVADVDGQPSLFNAGRIEDHHPLPEPAVLRQGQNLRAVWDELVTGFEPKQAVRVHALLRSTRVDLARRILGARLAAVMPPEGEWASVVVEYPDVESVRQLLQFGDHIRILRPAEAVQRVHDLAVQLANHHEATRPLGPGQSD